MFHAKDGLHFGRTSEGNIIVAVELNGEPIFKTELTPDAFASAITSVSKRGESAAHHEVALALLTGSE